MSANKERILEAASTLFLQSGMTALSVRNIARQAGLSTIGIYSHFEGKQGVLDALYQEGFESVSVAMTVSDDALSAKDAVLQAASNYMAFAVANPAHYQLIFGESDSGYQPGQQARMAGVEAFGKHVALMAALLPAGTSRSEQAFSAMQVWAMLHGAVALQRHAVGELVNMDKWRERVLQAVALLVEGIEKQYCEGAN